MSPKQRDSNDELDGRNIVITQQNVQSLRNKILQFEVFLRDQGSDVVLISEHWQTSHNIAMLCIQGYTLSAQFCREVNQHGGVAIFVRNNLEATPLAHISKICSVENILECCAVEIIKEKMIMVAVYRSPRNDIKSLTLFLEKFDELIQSLPRERKTLVIGGDFNIDFNCSSYFVQQFMDILTCYDLQVMVHDPTRVVGSSSKCIDNFLVSSALIETCKARVIQSNLSDHFAITMNVSISNNVFACKSTTHRNFNEVNCMKFCNLLKELSWQSVIEVEDCNSAFSAFMYAINNCFQAAFPLISSRDLSCKTKNRLPREILNAKYYLSVTADLNRQYPNIFKECFRAANNSYSKLLKDFKIASNDSVIATADNQNKAMWKIINKTVKQPSKRRQSYCIIQNGKELNTQECAEAFNEYFTTVAKSLVSSLDRRIDHEFVTSCCVNDISQSLFFSSYYC